MPKEAYEIIIIDDGSGDDLQFMNSKLASEKFSMNIVLIHEPNNGRAYARNRGIDQANAETIIFCDGDRIPDCDFVEQHLNCHNNVNNIVVGASYDFFGYKDVSNNFIEWEKVYKFSRLPNYFKKISKIYSDGITKSNLAWLSFLVGNSSVSKKILKQVGGFNESFTEWGFEHFEIALRIQKNFKQEFTLNLNAKNYHLPHPRKENFYLEMIQKSVRLLSDIHPEVNAEALEEIVSKNVDVLQYEDFIFIPR